jgi:hypothetical protein
LKKILLIDFNHTLYSPQSCCSRSRRTPQEGTRQEGWIQEDRQEGHQEGSTQEGCQEDPRQEGRQEGCCPQEVRITN